MAPPPSIRPTTSRLDCRSTRRIKSLHIPTLPRISFGPESRSSCSTTAFVTLRGIRPLSLPIRPNPLRISSPKSNLVSRCEASQRRLPMMRTNNVPSSGGFPFPCSPPPRRRLRPRPSPLPPSLRRQRQPLRPPALSLSDLFPSRRRRRRPRQRSVPRPPLSVRLPFHDRAGDCRTYTSVLPATPSQVDSVVTREYDSLAERMVKARAQLGSAPPRSQFVFSRVAVSSLAS